MINVLFAVGYKVVDVVKKESYDLKWKKKKDISYGFSIIFLS